MLCLFKADYLVDINGGYREFTLTTGEKICFNITIVDDDEVEEREAFNFYLDATDRYMPAEIFMLFHDYIWIYVLDNDGKLHYYMVSKNICDFRSQPFLLQGTE